jgi:hypothetical protein
VLRRGSLDVAGNRPLCTVVDPILDDRDLRPIKRLPAHGHSGLIAEAGYALI